MADNQPKEEQLYFGKYKTLEEAERGFRNLIGEADKWKNVSTTQAEQLKVLRETNEYLAAQKASSSSRVPEKVQLVSEDGSLDPRAIEQLIVEQQKPVIEALKQVPQMIQEQIRGFLAPIQTGMKAKEDFFARPDVDPQFTDAKMQEVLKRNPGINKAVQVLLAGPETQNEAYEVAYDLWRATSGKTGTGSAVPSQTKRDATEPVGMSGPPLATEGDPSIKMFEQLATRAQELTGPDAELSFAREWIKGTSLEKQIENGRPDWAQEK